MSGSVGYLRATKQTLWESHQGRRILFPSRLVAVQPPSSLVSGEGLSANMSAKGWRGLCMFVVMQGIGLLSYLADSHRGIGLWGSMLAVVSLFNITELQLLVKR
jgi:hypothetical protein